MHYEHNIRITSTNKLTNYFEGSIDEFSWSAVVLNETSIFGINPETLRRGGGKIVSLSIFRDDYGVEGNPYVPSMSIKRHIYANYKNDWDTFNRKYQKMVYELVNYLELRTSMHAL